MIIRLIRSKGVGIYFCTQSPSDIPDKVLGQLGLKIEHALRAFTAKDRKDIKLASENYPESDFYKIEDMVTSLGIGEAFVTVLGEKGNPTELVHTKIRPPESRMGTITETEINDFMTNSTLKEKYNKVLDSESAFEILNKRLQDKNNYPEDEDTKDRKQQR